MQSSGKNLYWILPFGEERFCNYLRLFRNGSVISEPAFVNYGKDAVSGTRWYPTCSGKSHQTHLPYSQVVKHKCDANSWHQFLTWRAEITDKFNKKINNWIIFCQHFGLHIDHFKRKKVWQSLIAPNSSSKVWVYVIFITLVSMYISEDRQALYITGSQKFVVWF